MVGMNGYLHIYHRLMGPWWGNQVRCPSGDGWAVSAELGLTRGIVKEGCPWRGANVECAGVCGSGVDLQDRP